VLPRCETTVRRVGVSSCAYCGGAQGTIVCERCVSTTMCMGRTRTRQCSFVPSEMKAHEHMDAPVALKGHTHTHQKHARVRQQLLAAADTQAHSYSQHPCAFWMCQCSAIACVAQKHSLRSEKRSSLVRGLAGGRAYPGSGAWSSACTCIGINTPRSPRSPLQPTVRAYIVGSRQTRACKTRTRSRHAPVRVVTRESENASTTKSAGCAAFRLLM
jgi:hypothetical protein